MNVRDINLVKKCSLMIILNWDTKKMKYPHYFPEEEEKMPTGDHSAL